MVKKVIGTMTVPKMKNLAEKSIDEIKRLRIKKVYWIGCSSLGLTLSDGESCMAGTKDGYESHTFDPAKKITKIVGLK